MKVEQFSRYLRALADVVGKKSVDPFAIDLYWEALKDCDQEKLEKALREFFSAGKWPSIDELKARMGTKEVDPAAKAKMVAEEIMRMVGMVGCPHAAAADEAMSRLSPIARTVVINRGGWPLVCEMTNADVQFRMREFEQSALVAIMSGKTDEYQQALEKPNGQVTNILSAIRDPSFPKKR